MHTTSRWAAIPILGTSDWAVAQGQSAVLDLIQWVCATHSSQSRKWLRQKIWLAPDTELTAAEQMAVRVFAKRTAISEHREVPPAWIEIQGAPHQPDLNHTISLPLRFASDTAVAEFLSQQLNRIPPSPGDRRILAMAVDSEQRPLAIARARNGQRRDAHAEWVLLQTLSPELLARTSRIWTTLKPCRFCAALLYPAALRGTEILYLEDDPGPWGRSTCLDAQSPDRRRFYPQDPDQRERFWRRPGDSSDSSMTSTNS